MKKIICITGLDGVGKSTLVDSFSKQLEDVYVADIWDLLNSPNQGLPFNSKKDIDAFLCDLTPDSRLLFLAHALKYSIDKAIQNDDDIILLNSYYYKYFATEKALGASSDLINSLIESFPKPDLVFQLELRVEKSVKRKKVLSRYECGLSQIPNETDFINFQKQVATAWHSYDRSVWHILNAEHSKEALLKETLSIAQKINCDFS